MPTTNVVSHLKKPGSPGSLMWIAEKLTECTGTWDGIETHDSNVKDLMPGETLRNQNEPENMASRTIPPDGRRSGTLTPPNRTPADGQPGIHLRRLLESPALRVQAIH